MTLPTLEQLLDAACHLGHPKTKWHPKMAPYIYGVQKGVHVFDLTQTREHLEQMCNELQKLQREGKTILFVSTKQQSIPILEEIGRTLHQPMVTKKWIPGLLTNWKTMKNRLKYYLDLQSSFSTGEADKYTKKEQTMMRKKLTKLDAALGGVAAMSKVPDALFVIDAVRDRVAVAEARVLGIPVYGICDSNADPAMFKIFVPANDDAVRSLVLIMDTVEEAMLEGGRAAASDKE